MGPPRVAPHPLPYPKYNELWYLWGDNNKHDTMRREGENDTTHIGCGSGPNPKPSHYGIASHGIENIKCRYEDFGRDPISY